MSNADTPPGDANEITKVLQEDTGLLHRLWTELHEQRKDDQYEFRTASFDFPPARGRSSLDLSESDTGRSITPGPVDKPVSHEGTWSIEGDTLLLDLPAWQGKYRILCLTGERLVLQKADE